MNQMTGFDVHIVAPLLMTVCIFYACLVGFEAVIWIDLIRATSTCAMLLFIFIKSSIDVGGFTTVIEESFDEGRIKDLFE